MKKCILAVYAALIMLLVAVPASAGNCAHVSYGYQQSYQTYTPTYAYNGYVNVVAQAVPYYLPLQTFASVGDDARSYYTTKDAVKAGTLEALREFQASSQPVGPPSSAPQPGNGNLASPNVSAAPAGIVAQARKVFTDSCVKCHSSKDPERLDLTKDVFTQFDQRHYKSVNEQWGDILRRTVNEGGKGAMPKGGKTLDQAGLNTLLDATDAVYSGALTAKAPQIPPAK